MIKNEISSQILAGNLPAPTLDSLGNPRTYYAIFFPPGISISLGTSLSCSYFCAYHGTVAASGITNEYYYGVHPDMTPGSGKQFLFPFYKVKLMRYILSLTGCYYGCGSGSVFDNYCEVASHELVEMITGESISSVLMHSFNY